MRWSSIAALLVLVGLRAATAIAEVPAAPGSLFGSDTTLELTLSADFSALRQDRDVRIHREGRLDVTDAAGVSHSIPVALKTRGRFRLAGGNCDFPQLFIRFTGDTSETPFAGQAVLPLTTHCKKSGYYEQYVLQEYLAYRVFLLLTERGLRTRLAKVLYRDTTGKRGDVARLAFFTEHFDTLAGRLGCQIRTIDPFDPHQADPYAAGLMEVFQYMIGNTDWSIVHQHNVLLLECPSERITPVPYDLDWSGVVNARYAYPGAELKIRTVRQRIYRGVCRPDATFDAIFRRVNAIRPAISAMYRNQPNLQRKTLKRTLDYYDKFYEILATPKKLRKKILDACHSIRTTSTTPPEPTRYRR